MRLSYNFLIFEANNELVNNPIRYQYFCSRLYCICDCSFGIILLKAVGRVVQQMLYFEAEKTQGKS